MRARQTTRCRAIELIVTDILASGASMNDERIKPELRDILRLAKGQGALTVVGKAMVALAQKQLDEEAAER